MTDDDVKNSNNNDDLFDTDKHQSSVNTQEKLYTPNDYFPALEKWLHEAYMWQNVVASFPYFLLYNHCANHSGSLNSLNVPGTLAFNGNNYSTPNYFQQQIGRNENTTTQDSSVEGIECRIPPMWKRLIAEFLDFSILFILKLGVTFIAIDFFEIIDLDKFDFDLLYKDVKTALQITHDIMLLEIIHRVVVCIFETLWLAKGLGGRIGGATPGKTMLGLCVVRCESITSLSPDDELLLIKPGTDLGIKYAFMRSLIKNLVLSIFIPACFAFLYFRYNRAGYDMLCNTIVVEEPVRRYRPHQQ